MLIILFLLPLAFYLLAHRWLTPARSHWLPRYAILYGAFVTLVSLYVILFSGTWPAGTQIVWRGLESGTGKLTLGGPREEAGIGWPNGAFAPRLEAQRENQAVRLTLTQGGAFVWDENRQAFLNGLPLPVEQPVKLGNGQIVWHSGGLFSSEELEILDAQQKSLARIAPPPVAKDKDRVYALANLLGRKFMQTPADATNLVAAEQWAADKWLLRTRAGELRLLGATDETKNAAPTCVLPCRLTALWPNYKLPFVLLAEKDKLQLLFAPPWRRTSPLPPPNKDGKRLLAVTDNPLPGDVAFAIPLGYGLAESKPTIEIGTDANGLPALTGAGAISAAQTPPRPPPLPGPQPLNPLETLDIGAQVISWQPVTFGDFSVLLATVNDLPSAWGLAWRLVLLFFLVYLTGILLVLEPESNAPQYHSRRRVFYGLLMSLWAFLQLRFLLSLRMAAEPNYLDRLTVKGVTVALLGLALGLGCVVLWARLRLDCVTPLRDALSRRRRWQKCFFYWLLLAFLSALQVWRTPHLWANLPARFQPGWLWALVPLAGLAYLLGALWAVYRADEDSRLADCLTVPLRADWLLVRKGQEYWGKLTNESPLWLLASLIIALSLFVALAFFSRWSPQSELVQETILLPVLGLGAALFWLTGRFYFSDEDNEMPGRVRRLACLLAAFVLPCFALPLLFGDVGGFLATFAFFAPVMVLLLLWQPRKFGVWMAVLLAAPLIFVFYASPLLSHLPGAAGVRLLVFQEDKNILGYFLRADVDGDEGLPLQKLRDAYQHTWEAKAIAYQGGWLGLGYSHAPTRQSQVRQDTIQSDSLYSFFIASEYGWLGGVALLLLFAWPFCLTLYGGWLERFHFGYAAASVITGAFLLEAALHAGMNLGAFPVTGRSLPLLDVNSTTTLVRWTLLFCGVTQLLTWRDRFATEAAEVPQNPPLSDDDEEEINFIPLGFAGGRALPRWLGLSAVAALPLLLVAWVALTHARLIRNSVYSEPFEWRGVLKRVDTLIADGVIEVNPDKTLTPHLGGYGVADGALISQEILRFNALPPEEREDSFATRELQDKLKTLNSVESYNRLLDELRREKVNENRRPRPSLFRLLPPEQVATDRGLETRGGPRVTANPAYNVRRSFQPGAGPENLPKVTFRDGKTVILGPAWVSGQWVTVVEPASYIAWARPLARALESEWQRQELGPELASARYGKLALDANLHKAAAKFAAAKGHELHRSLFAASSTGATKTGPAETPPKPVGANALPPRVALAVLSLPRGETLALGGYPRMTAFNRWRPFDPQKPDEWLPPSEWVERAAPQVLRQLYGGDRNFDTMVVGSTTKPLWASVALAVHPNLARLATRGNGGVESQIFGIELGEKEAWEVPHQPDWVNFTSYLAHSDNRYQIRLGFLGLAGDEKDVQTVGKSGSVQESMDGGRTVWGQTPRFTNLEFSAKQPTQLKHLETTSLSRHWENMYFINAGPRRLARRYSFWTKNEADDFLLDNTSAGTSGALAGLAPERADLRLAAIAKPRDYIALLLGGQSNQWANVELAAAFGTCLTGRPVVAHAPLDTADNKGELLPAAAREEFTAIAEKVRPGLAEVVKSGTAKELAMPSWPAGYKVYAKTGTLNSAFPGRYTSRLVFAVVRWADEGKGIIQSGLVFSLVAEQADKKAAVRWLGEFLKSNEKDIIPLLQAN